MNKENTGSSAPSCCSQQSEQGTAPCGCPCRKWVYGGLLLLIVAAGVVAWIAYQQIGGSLRNTPQYQAAMEKIRGNEEIRAALGQPITDSWRTGGQAEAMQFEVYGPKGWAKVRLEPRKLDVTPQPSGRTVSIPWGEGSEAPPYSPPPAAAAKPPASSPAAAPPTDSAKPPAGGSGPEIKIEMPSPPGGGP
jgi:hypothetical protein